jgi:hypothetical protein
MTCPFRANAHKSCHFLTWSNCRRGGPCQGGVSNQKLSSQAGSRSTNHDFYQLLCPAPPNGNTFDFLLEAKSTPAHVSHPPNFPILFYGFMLKTQHVVDLHCWAVEFRHDNSTGFERSACIFSVTIGSLARPIGDFIRP